MLDPNSVKGYERSPEVDVEGLVDVQISLHNGDQNLFERSVEVQCQLHNEQDSEQEEQTKKEEESEEGEDGEDEEDRSYEASDRETTGQMSWLALRKVVMTFQVMKGATMVHLGHFSCQNPWLTISGT